jgi:hypothetical protein
MFVRRRVYHNQWVLALAERAHPLLKSDWEYILGITFGTVNGLQKKLAAGMGQHQQTWPSGGLVVQDIAS